MIQYGDQRALLFFLPDWAALLLIAMLATWTVCMVGLALAKTGRSPFWAILVFVPFLAVPALWAWAYGRWPRLAEGARRE